MFQDILRRFSAETETSNPVFFKQVIQRIRPHQPGHVEWAEKNIAEFLAQLEQENLSKLFGGYVLRLMQGTDVKRFVTEAGIPQGDAFFVEITKRMKHKILPPLLEEHDLQELVSSIFYRKTDYIWLELVSADTWRHIFKIFGWEEAQGPGAGMQAQILNAVLILSHRITAMGLDRAIADKMTEVDELNSPFIGQSREVMAYFEKVQKTPVFTSDDTDYRQILVLLGQCEAIIKELRTKKQSYGASLYLTYLMSRLMQTIQRMQFLLKLLHAAPEGRLDVVVAMLCMLVRADNLKNSIGAHINENIGLLAFQVVENAGKTGEHYITSDRKEYVKFWKSSMGGGFIVGWLAIFKLLLYYLKLAPFWQAFSYSLNYAAGFILIHVTHSALATKQPAMTASHIAGSLDRRTGDGVSLTGLALMIAKVFRSQFISFVGNLMICFPMGVLLAGLWFVLFGEHIADPEKAHHLMHDVHPWETGALIFAAITGVYLFISGLISGYFDNWVVYRSIAVRLQKSRTLNKLLGARLTHTFTRYLEHNMGSLAGNFFLGFFLGCTSIFGDFFGLTIDIRHITFSAASYGIGLVGVNFDVHWQEACIAVLGIFGIGLMNFSFSFGLAFMVAIRSRKLRFMQTRKFVGVLRKYFLRYPADFFFPPAKLRSEADMSWILAEVETESLESKINNQSKV